jgi:hypothetical protein
MASFRRWEKGHQQHSTVNSQNTEDDLKILLRILSILQSTIATLIHLRDQAVYVWMTFDTVRIRSATDSRVIRNVAYAVGRSTFNPHLPRDFSFLSTREYRLPGIEVSEHRRVTILGVGRRVAIRSGSQVYIYIGDGNWRGFDFGRSWTSESRGWVLGQDEERKSEIDRRLYLFQ